MKIVNVTPGLLPIPPNGWGAVEKIIWETHKCLLELGHESQILYLDEIRYYDVVHIHVANLANLAHERGIPYYFTMHDHHAFLYGKDSAVYKENLQAIKNAKKAFVPAKFLVDYFEGIPEYFSHGVNTNYFTPGEFEEHKLLCVANNGFIHDQSEDRKGFSYAIEAAKKLNLPITIAGPSNNKNYFSKFPSDYGKLTILYDLNEEQLRTLYKQHSVFVHASILEAGHPNLTLLEAMSSGLPVVGTFESSNALRGMVVVNRDTDQVIKGVEEVISNYAFFKQQALIQARDLSWKNRTQSLLEKYSSNMTNQLADSYRNTTKLAIESKIPIPEFNINFIDGAFLEIKGGPKVEYDVKFTDQKTGIVHYSGKMKPDHWMRTSISYFVDWKITANDGTHEYEYNIDLKDQRVYVALESKSLGDTLAWFPQIKEFEKKHGCKLIVSTFWNSFFESEYPEFKFISPGEVVHNLHAMYLIGWFYKEDGTIDSTRNPNDFKVERLQKTASDILGLEYREVKPKMAVKKDVEKEKIVTIAVHSTAQAKYWNNSKGWQEVVDCVKSLGYRVVMLSKESDGFMGNMNPKGIEYLEDYSMESTIDMLQRSHMFIGISSGLSWLSWALGVKTCVISGFSDPVTEFEDCTRIYTESNYCKGCFNTHKLDPGDWNWCPVNKGTDRQFECSKTITGDTVISKIKHLL
jgi:autotransporter strand-loop-strand O-heptosyltransferase